MYKQIPPLETECMQKKQQIAWGRRAANIGWPKMFTKMEPCGSNTVAAASRI